MSVRASLIGVVGGVAIGAGLLLLPSGASAAPETLTVGNLSTCPNADYGTIQAAVDNAASGDTISVCPGTYGEHVTINTPDLTILGGQHGVDARGKRNKQLNSTVSDPTGEFTLGGSADGTTIDGFVLTGSTGDTDAIIAFQGSSGLTLVNNVIQNNGNGIFLANPDGSQPATISQNSFVNNNAGGAGDAGTGSGIFICCGAGNNVLINNNNFRGHSQTAINTAGDSSNPSTGVVISDNKSVDDSSFVVATNTSGAVIDHNNVTASGDHGTGILDFGANTALRVTNNIMKATGSSQSSGISVSNYNGSSQYTNVLTNTITGYYNDLKIVSGSRNAYANGNKLFNAGNDGIVVQTDVSGATISRNQVSNAMHFSCEDPTTGGGTAGTANIYLNNVATSDSSPVGICRNKNAA